MYEKVSIHIILPLILQRNACKQSQGLHSYIPKTSFPGHQRYNQIKMNSTISWTNENLLPSLLLPSSCRWNVKKIRFWDYIISEKIMLSARIICHPQMTSPQTGAPSEWVWPNPSIFRVEFLNPSILEKSIKTVILTPI